MKLTQAQKDEADAMVLKTALEDARNKSLRYYSADNDASISRALSGINDLLEYLVEAQSIDGIYQPEIDECIATLKSEQHKAKAALIRCIKETVGIVLMHNRDTDDLQWSINLESLHGYDFFMSEREFNYININLARSDWSDSDEITSDIKTLRKLYKDRTNFLFGTLKKIAE